MKQITLCADDYGQNPAISQAIINLIKKKRLSATSCMSNMLSWADSAQMLIPYINQLDIGLHFNLTEGLPLSDAFRKRYGNSLFPLSRLLVKSQLRLLDMHTITAELNAQLDAFVEKIGMLPDFIDGHQHVHVLPVVREAVLSVYENRLRSAGGYVRSVWEANAWMRFRASGYVKRVIIQMMGAKQFKQKLEAQTIPHNTSFSGAYDFVEAKEYVTRFMDFLDQVKQGGLVMCHPGMIQADQEDAIGASRVVEYDYFGGSVFEALLSSRLQLVRFKDRILNVPF